MATTEDVFYSARCTFWTGDWAWLRARARRGPAMVEGADVTQFGDAQPASIRARDVTPLIPCCPFCGSVGFEMPREQWMAQARAWEAGASPAMPGVTHPGYVAMLTWSEKRCYPDYDALATAWRRVVPA